MRRYLVGKYIRICICVFAAFPDLAPNQMYLIIIIMILIIIINKYGIVSEISGGP